MSVSSTTLTTAAESARPLHSTSFSCPACRTEMGRLDDSSSSYVRCPNCSFVIQERNGVLRALRPEREQYFRQFVEQYETVRTREGRGSSSADFYAALPFRDLTGKNTWEWNIRGRTFAHALKHIFPAIEAAHPKGFDLLDIGAGNCWMSYQMAKRGHRPIALDLLDNETDGLGAARFYSEYLRQPFLTVQAEMDYLPFSAAQFDVVFFNASFHYSVDYEETVGEALRCLRRPGHLIISDSPFYRGELSGPKMIEEKRLGFEKRYGFRSDSVPSREYLTRPILDRLAHKFGLRWKTLKPWYGMNWALRPLKASLSGKREPSKFYLFWAEVQRSAKAERAQVSRDGSRTK
jgi:SAM-dependent methyltransferase/DNA-directed RNA polymerase subunit RPC12/RpoP